MDEVLRKCFHTAVWRASTNTGITGITHKV